VKNPPRYDRQPARYDVPDDIATGIGRLLVRWAYLEHALQTIVWMLVGVTQPVGRLAIREPRMPERIRLIEDLANLRGVDLPEKVLKAISARATDIGRNRDLLAHGHWTFEETTSTWHVIMTRGKWSDDEPHPRAKSIVPEALIVTSLALQGIQDQLDLVIKSVERLAEQVEILLPPPPEVHPLQFPRKSPLPSRHPSKPK
jgi:hypothetical protein